MALLSHCPEPVDAPAIAGAPLSPTRPSRVLWLDVARGVAIVAMVAYHLSFDLSLFGYVDWAVTSDPAWRTFAASIASTFLFLVGVSLVLAHGERIRWRPFARRLALVAAGAAAVTAGTVALMPTPIYFGILHAIALYSVVGLAFVRAPAALTALVALAVFVLPHVVRDPLFASPWAYPLGLAPNNPITLDYEPVFPWLGATLAGIAFARLATLHPTEGAVPAPLRWLRALGRWSFVIYLVHQPVLFGLFMEVGALS